MNDFRSPEAIEKAIERNADASGQLGKETPVRRDLKHLSIQLQRSVLIAAMNGDEELAEEIIKDGENI